MNTPRVWKQILSGMLFLAAGAAHASLTPISVPEIKLKNIPPMSNSAVSVFYAIGSKATNTPFIRKISAGPVHADIHSDGTASFDAISVPRSGFQIFGYLVFVVHPTSFEPAHICNVWGSIPGNDGITDQSCPDDYMKSIKTYYRRVDLTDDKTKISAIEGNAIDGTSPIVIDLGAK